jgi:uncharacterized iron-regulated membrane protein
MRQAALYLHRYIGLGLTAFLLVIGLTGCVIAWFTPLDELINPDLLHVEPRGAAIPVLDLRERLAAELPDAHVYYVHFPERPDQSLSVYTEGAIDPVTGESRELDYDEVFVDPYSGEQLGRRMWGDFSLQRKDLVTQLYFLHYSLVLPEELGEGFMGIVALVWAFDCLVGLYLTLPPGNAQKTKAGFWQRWLPAWKIKFGAGNNRMLYDWHRAASLWVWGVLLVFAVSGFAINLPATYERMMGSISGYEDPEVGNDLDAPLLDPAIGWTQALAFGEGYMATLARDEGFTINRPAALIYRREQGQYYYRVHSSRDVVSYGETTVAIDGMNGTLAGVEIPTGHSAGTTFTSWIKGLHMAMVFGWPWRLFVSVMGLVVVSLAVTGVAIWWRKRRRARKVVQQAVTA